MRGVVSDVDVRRELPFELQRDESVLWRSTPERGSIVDRRDVVLIPLGVLFTAFIIVWIVALPAGIPVLLVFGVVLLGYFSYLLFGRLIVRRLVLNRIEYAITNQRIVVCRRSLNQRRTRIKDRRIEHLNEGVLIDTVRDGVFNVYIGRMSLSGRLWASPGTPSGALKDRGTLSLVWCRDHAEAISALKNLHVPYCESAWFGADPMVPI